MDLNRTRTRAEWEITVGQLTVAAILVARLVTVYLQLRAAGSLNPVDFGLAVLKSGILILALLFYRRSVWPALLMQLFGLLVFFTRGSAFLTRVYPFSLLVCW